MLSHRLLPLLPPALPKRTEQVALHPLTQVLHLSTRRPAQDLRGGLKVTEADRPGVRPKRQGIKVQCEHQGGPILMQLKAPGLQLPGVVVSQVVPEVSWDAVQARVTPVTSGVAASCHAARYQRLLSALGEAERVQADLHARRLPREAE